MKKDIPTYIPPHLQDRASNFTRNPDGTLSFEDSKLADMGADPNVTLTPEQEAATFTTNYLATRGQDRPEDMYGAAKVHEDTLIDKAVNFAGNVAHKGLSTVFSNPMALGSAATLLSALAARHFIKNKKLNEGEGEEAASSSANKWGLGTAALTAALSGLAYYKLKDQVPTTQYLTKYSSAPDIIAAVSSDSTLTYAQQAALLSAISHLSTEQEAELNRKIGYATGAGVGAIVARFLLGLGVPGTILGGIVGGAIGSSAFFNPPTYDAFGNIRI